MAMSAKSAGAKPSAKPAPKIPPKAMGKKGSTMGASKY